MGGGRKNLKREVNDDGLTLTEGQSIMQVISLRGSNLIEVVDAKGDKSLAMFPAKFQKSMWVKRGSYVVVDGSGREEALKSGSKVACIVSRVLFYEQVRRLRKSPDWPEVFKLTNAETSAQEETSKLQNDITKLSTDLGSKMNVQEPTSQPEEDEVSLDEDEGLPPLVTNTNRTRPYELYSDTETDESSDKDS